ncbi:MOSC N-terminal beta barrel domain-containing protein [Halomonas sp. CH40]
MQVNALYCYPVKSMQGIRLDQARLYRHGFEWDRRWMLVDRQQCFVTQRQLPALATLKVVITDSALVLSHPQAGSIEVPLEAPSSAAESVRVWQDDCQAQPESEYVTEWLESALGSAAQGLRLMRFADGFTRAVAEDAFGHQQAHTFFADGYPYLATTTASLQALNQALSEKGLDTVPMSRFRPNIVIEHDEAWGEDRWGGIQTLPVEDGEKAELVFCEPCQRCKVTTIDQQTAQVPVPAEPLKTLLALNTQPALKGAHFGQNALLASREGAFIRVGDPIAVLPDA